MNSTKAIPLKTIGLISVMFFASFGNSNNLSSQDVNKEVAKIKEKYKDVKPCEVFTEKELKDYFALPGDLDIRVKDSDYPYPTCSSTWTIGTKRESELNGMKYETDVWNRFNFVVVPGVGQSAFEPATSRYKDKEMISVGDLAAWSAKSKQITVMVDKTLFHLQINTPDYEKDVKAMLIEVSNLIIPKLR
jgi:hypothetical protein